MKGCLNFCDDPTHVRVYTIVEIANILLKKNFKILRAGRHKVILNNILFVPKLIKINILWDYGWCFLGYI